MPNPISKTEHGEYSWDFRESMHMEAITQVIAEKSRRGPATDVRWNPVTRKMELVYDRRADNPADSSAGQ